MRGTKKDAFYFPHDSNARDDIKCVELLGVLGVEGYGIFWILIEMLREQPEYKYPVKLLPVIAKRYCVAPETVNDVVNKFGLFIVDENGFFFSESLSRRMATMDGKKEQARLAGEISALKRAEKQKKILEELKSKTTDVQQVFNDRLTDVQPKRKEKKKEENIKKDESITPPTLEEVKQYIQAKNYIIDAGRFYAYYTSKKWQGVYDWRAKADQWNAEDLSKQPPQGVKLGVGEYMDNGRRTYGTGKATIPMNAPPRPSEGYCWDAATKQWIFA